MTDFGPLRDISAGKVSCNDKNTLEFFFFLMNTGYIFNEANWIKLAHFVVLIIHPPLEM